MNLTQNFFFGWGVDYTFNIIIKFSRVPIVKPLRIQKHVNVFNLFFVEWFHGLDIILWLKKVNEMFLFFGSNQSD